MCKLQKILITLLLVVGLASCGSNPPTNPASTNPETTLEKLQQEKKVLIENTADSFVELLSLLTPLINNPKLELAPDQVSQFNSLRSKASTEYVVNHLNAACSNLEKNDKELVPTIKALVSRLHNVVSTYDSAKKIKNYITKLEESQEDFERGICGLLAPFFFNYAKWSTTSRK